MVLILAVATEISAAKFRVAAVKFLNEFKP